MFTQRVLKLSSFSIACLAIMALTFTIGGCSNSGGSSDNKPHVAFVTNNVSEFWQIAKKGCMKAEQEFNCVVEFRMPANGTIAEQQQIIEDLLAKGIDGIAISPRDAQNQTDILNKAAAETNLICHDSDAPNTNRLCYVGTNNFQAGLAAGKLIKEVLPEGGKIILFVGVMDAPNARERAEGISKELEGSNIEIADIRTDQADHVTAKSNVENVLVTRPDVTCLVGLWSYNGPAIVSAVTEKNQSVAQGGTIKIVCFDEEEDCLQGIKDGHIYATVVQKPFEFGYQSVRILAQLAEGDKTVLPEDGLLDTGIVLVKQDNVQTFWDELKQLQH